MSKKYFFANLIIFTLLFSLSITGYQNTTAKYYDQSDNKITSYSTKKIWDCVVKVTSSPLYVSTSEKDNQETEEFPFGGGHGSGFIFYKDLEKVYLLTAFHVIDAPEHPHSLFGMNALFTLRRVKYIITSELFPEPYEAVFEFGSEQWDIAVLSIEKDNFSKNLPYYNVFGLSNRLYPGSVVYGIGYPGNFGKLLTSGKLACYPDYREDVFIIDKHINFGDSGGPQFVFSEGRPLIIGLGRYKFRQDGISGVCKSDYIVELLKENGLGFIVY